MCYLAPDFNALQLNRSINEYYIVLYNINSLFGQFYVQFVKKKSIQYILEIVDLLGTQSVVRNGTITKSITPSTLFVCSRT